MAFGVKSAYLQYEVEDERPLAVGEYEAPEDIRLENGRLRWQPIERTHVVRPTTKILTGFLDLASGSDTDILNYARRWGVLSLCREHSVPSSHAVGCVPYECKLVGGTTLPDDFNRPMGEPVSEWRRWSRIVRVILNLRAQLEVKRVGSDEQWQALIEDRWLLDPEDWMRDRAKARSNRVELAWERQSVANFMSTLMVTGNVRPKMTWNGPLPEFTLSGAGQEYWLRSGLPVGVELFGALAVQILENGGRYVITGCTGCGRFYDATPTGKRGSKRRPKVGYGRFCKECKANNVPIKLAQRNAAIDRQRQPAKRAIKARKR